MRDTVIVDTNVAVVANGRTAQASPSCIVACIERLSHVKDRNLVLLDAESLIFDEYRRHLSPSGQPGTGDMFFKWLWNNQAQQQHCRKIEITPNDERGFDEFPDDPMLTEFDDDDRKFVAVALASGMRPPILNASDTDWYEYRQDLKRHDLRIIFVCPELMVARR